MKWSLTILIPFLWAFPRLLPSNLHFPLCALKRAFCRQQTVGPSFSLMFVCSVLRLDNLTYLAFHQLLIGKHSLLLFPVCLFVCFNCFTVPLSHSFFLSSSVICVGFLFVCFGDGVHGFPFLIFYVCCKLLLCLQHKAQTKHLDYRSIR